MAGVFSTLYWGPVDTIRYHLCHITNVDAKHWCRIGGIVCCNLVALGLSRLLFRDPSKVLTQRLIRF